MSSDSEENLSDISLDEEDEELIWRVFYGDYEKKMSSSNNSAYPSDDEEDEDSDEYSEEDSESENHIASSATAVATGAESTKPSEGGAKTSTSAEGDKLPGSDGNTLTGQPTANTDEGSNDVSAESKSKPERRKRKRDASYVSINDEVSDISDIDDLDLVTRYEELKGLQKRKKSENPSQRQSPFRLPVLNEEEKKRLIISSFTDEQMDRFEAYRRMTVNKAGVKKVCNGVLGHSIAQNIAVVLAGLSKSFLGEIISRAMDIQERDFKARLIIDIENKKKQKLKILKSLENGKEVEVEDKKLEYLGDKQASLHPDHIREAWRLYKLENSGDLKAPWRNQGDGDGKMFR